MKILVTGGCGFIGKHLVAKLRKMRHDVVCIDIKGDPDYFVDISVLQEFDILNNIKFDVIYHLAAMSYGRGSEENPHLDIQNNVEGTFNVCTYAKKHNIEKLIYTSTMAVYGNRDNATEGDTLDPLSNYACSKLYGEYCIKRFKEFNVDSVIFRLFNTYGPGSDLANIHKGIVNAFVSQLQEDNISVTGSLDRYRDLIYIDDVIDALIRGVVITPGVYNVCSGNKTTIRELIKLINTNNLPVVESEGHSGDQSGSTGSNLKLRSVGWECKTALKQGLKNILG